MRVGRPVQRPREIPKAPQNFIPPILTSKTAFSAFANRRFRSSILNRGQADSYEDVSNNYAFRGTNVTLPLAQTNARTLRTPFYSSIAVHCSGACKHADRRRRRCRTPGPFPDGQKTRIRTRTRSCRRPERQFFLSPISG